MEETEGEKILFKGTGPLLTHTQALLEDTDDTASVNLKNVKQM